MAKILIVEDDTGLARRLNKWLSLEHHLVDTVHDGQDAIDRLRSCHYEVIILDWALPKLSGLEVCKQYRSAGGKAPILMLTGKQEITEKEQGLDAGADDYLTKPFHLKELTARIRALLRRPGAVLANQLQVGDIVLDANAHRVTKGGVEIELLPKELDLLQFLMRNPNNVFSPEALLDRVWSSDSESSVYTVYTYIKTLRKKLSSDGESSVIKNIYGRGYILESK